MSTGAAAERTSRALVAGRTATPLVLADFGSTYTKVTVVDPSEGRLLATARHPTTISTDVLDGLDRALDGLRTELPGIDDAEVVACSSAGGGLRIGVIGLERDLTAEAARLAALSAGGRVDVVLAGRDLALDDLVVDPPDMVLLTGGTDGGDATALVAAARALARASLDGVPVVVAGNAEAQDAAAEVLCAAGRSVARAANVMPEIGVLSSEGAREVICRQFLEHVIGGKQLSRSGRFVEIVRMPTPDAVLRGVELLAHGTGDQPGHGPVVLVDVGGATTDVHSVVAPEPGADGRERPLLPQAQAARTVEGDLGLRWNAPGIVAAARDEGLVAGDEAARLADAAARRAADPAFVPDDGAERTIDVRLAGLAARIAVLRHAGRLAVTLGADGASVRREGRDLRGVALVAGTGGIFEHGDKRAMGAALDAACAPSQRRLLPSPRRLRADRRYLVAAAGLLSGERPSEALRLLADQLAPLPRPSKGPTSWPISTSTP